MIRTIGAVVAVNGGAWPQFDSRHDRLLRDVVQNPSSRRGSIFWRARSMQGQPMQSIWSPSRPLPRIRRTYRDDREGAAAHLHEAGHRVTVKGHTNEGAPA
jgi:hypothetical protein